MAKTDDDKRIALDHAFDSTPDSLFALGQMTASVRNAPEIYDELGRTSAAKADVVIDYIRSQCETEDDVLFLAVRALESINTRNAELLIVDICTKLTKPNSQHASYIGAECICSLGRMGTETAADHILVLGRSHDDLVLQAMTSLCNLYDSDNARFRPQYKLMTEFAVDRGVLARTLAIEFGTPDEDNLRRAFANADTRGILSRDSFMLGGDHTKTQGYCVTAFELAVRETSLSRQLEAIGAEWDALHSIPRPQ